LASPNVLSGSGGSHDLRILTAELVLRPSRRKAVVEQPAVELSVDQHAGRQRRAEEIGLRRRHHDLGATHLFVGGHAADEELGDGTIARQQVQHIACLRADQRCDVVPITTWFWLMIDDTSRPMTTPIESIGNAVTDIGKVHEPSGAGA
jgi:hypothetical protein